MSSNTQPIGAVGTSTATTAASSAAAASAANSAAALNINPQQFLQLITTQMQDQNPLQPTDPTQFMSQLEGLSEVSSLQSLQTALASNMQATQMASSTSLLGRTVLAAGSSAALTSGGKINGAVTAPSGATGLTVTISNAAGTPVASFSVPPQASGLTSFSWNGATSAGTTAPAGQYLVSVNAQVGSSTQPVSALIASQVTSVTIDPTTQILDLNTTNGPVPLSSVVSVQ
jgi:flagellar basal-body rod modification protein FlgD